ncbi:MAG TPA: maleylpyruvate isomerase family mycothiol-dependent enzyme [Streptosporangiaceae bacterium]|jgi:uncharacterized protein (TIGR03083 family)
MTWDHAGCCDAVEAEIGRFADVARGADLTVQVTTCPEWSLADLIEHTGGIHRWAGAMVRDLAQRRYRRTEWDLGLPGRHDDYPVWLADGVRHVVAPLRAADPDAPMWAWGADQHARFWSRRMLHETTVHRADAELALGRDPQIAPDVAADGIVEFFDNLPGAAASFAPNLGKLRGDGEIIALTAPDDSWLVTLGPDGPTVDLGDGPATLTVRAGVADLMLFVWGRRKPGDPRLDISGDPALLTHWLTHSAV